MEQHTIIAQCTPRGSGAIALLRLSGPCAFTIADKIGQLASGKTILDVPSHTIHLGVVRDEHHVIDQVMFLVMHAPRTFTGENTVEITCHNNPFIIEAIIALAIKQGARAAQEGEFSRQAVLNGKMDLLQAEAVNELIHANTQFALKQSLAQLQGSFSSWIAQLEQQLVKALAFCQASFEFIDEEHMTFDDDIKIILQHIITTINELKITFDQQQRIRNGIRIALIGSVNAGKSSLFNSLLRQKRAIVTDIAGTTRDVIEAGVYKDNNYWTLIDTAGLRQTDDIIEKEGIERSLQEAASADIILLVIDASRSMHPQEKTTLEIIKQQHAQKIITLYNKTDLPAQIALDAQGIAVSAQNPQDALRIEAALEQKIAVLFSSLASPFLLSKRHYNLLLSLEQSCQQMLALFERPIAYELLSVHLQEAAALISELTGKSISESAMDQVFKQFCVGK